MIIAFTFNLTYLTVTHNIPDILDKVQIQAPVWPSQLLFIPETISGGMGAI